MSGQRPGPRRGWWICLSLAAGQVLHAAPLISLERILSEPLDQRVAQLERLDDPGRAALVRVAFDPRQTLAHRWRAVTAMGRLDHAVFGPVIHRALRADEWFLRNAALNDGALVVRTQAVRNLIHLNARASESALWRALNDRRNFSGRGESLWIRAHVVEALARFASPGRARAFQKLLGDADPRVHPWAVRGLENSVGVRLTEPGAPIELARRRWAIRLGTGAI